MAPASSPTTRAVTLMEVSPRDGLQNEQAELTTEEKLELIQWAIDAGAQRIEVTSFVHPKKVPRMADAEAVCAGLPQRGDVRYTGLILNDRGYQRLLATERLDEAGFVIPVSDTFGEKNQGQSVAEATEAAAAVLKDARTRGFPAQATLAVAFGCPFEGNVPAQRTIDTAKRLAEEDPVEIGLADTIGVGVPSQVTDLFGELRHQLGPDMPLRAHFHDTRNTGIANAWAALEAGVATLDASIGGIGGCPFAPNATGNIASEDLLYMLNRSDVDHGVDIDRLIEAASWLEARLAKAVPSALLRAGNFPAEPEPPGQ